MTNFLQRLVLILAGSLALTAIGDAGEDLEAVIQLEQQVAKEGINSQQVISQLSEEARVLLEEFRAVRLRTKNLKKYNSELRALVEAQKDEAASIEAQIDRSAVIEREIVPLMSEMVATLERFVALDLPFLIDERNKRVRALAKILKRTNVSTAEKFRRILEAYQIESEYGRTVDAYRATLDIDASPRMVDVLRVGRIALLYRTLDGALVGSWDQTQHRWRSLPGEYEGFLRKGLMIARKQIAPDMMTVPVTVTPSSQ